uniref:Uncharacterized protein n=1 Tax=Arundo donax TaxID=35708 RepID=A0A0A8YCX8_ARUDO
MQTSILVRLRYLLRLISVCRVDVLT